MTDFNIKNILGDFLGGLGGAYFLQRGGYDMMQKSKLALTFAVAHIVSLKITSKMSYSSVWWSILVDTGVTSGLIYGFDTWYYGGADVQSTVTYTLTSMLLGEVAKGFIPGATQLYIPLMSASV
jgi:hypothetical protein